MADALHTLSAAELGRRLAAGALTSRALCEALIARYQAVNEKVGAFTHLDQADVLAQADASDARRHLGKIFHLDLWKIGVVHHCRNIDECLVVRTSVPTPLFFAGCLSFLDFFVCRSFCKIAFYSLQ